MSEKDPNFNLNSEELQEDLQKRLEQKGVVLPSEEVRLDAAPKENIEQAAETVARPNVSPEILAVLKNILTHNGDPYFEITDEQSNPATPREWARRLRLTTAKQFLYVAANMPNFFVTVKSESLNFGTKGTTTQSKEKYIFTGRSEFLKMMEATRNK